MVTKIFDQYHLSISIADEWPIGKIVIGNFLPEFGELAGKVVSVNEKNKTVTFTQATKEETNQKLGEVFSHLR